MGDDRSFEEVYDAVAARLFSYLRRNVRDAHRCSDLLQETFLQMHRARGTFLPGAAVMPWAFAIARRLVIDQERKARRSPPIADVSDPQLTPFEDLASHDDHAVLDRELELSFARELSRLPESQRTVFELLKRDGLSLAEAAQVLGVTVTAVKLRAHRAYVSLRAALGERAERLTEVGT